MQDDLLFQEIILRHLNEPADVLLDNEVARIRATSDEHEKLYQDVVRIWEASAETKRLHAVDFDQAVYNFRHQLGPDDQFKKRKWFVWPQIAAAVVLLCAFGIWAYYYNNTSPVYLTKATDSKLDSVTLSDGTKIILAANSMVSYPELFDVKERKVTLLKGQAFFLVTRDPNRPFDVAVKQSRVSVLGTSFNINYSDSEIKLSVKTGKVMFTPNTKSSPAILTAGEGIEYNYSKNTLEFQDGHNANSWITKKLQFVDMPLDHVCKQLSDYYGVEIILHDDVRSVKKFNANFNDVNLQEALTVLKETYAIKVEQKNQTIIIKSL